MYTGLQSGIHLARAANLHPGGGLIGDVISPFRTIRFIFSWMFVDGIAERSAFV
jgi:hypothetical protein